MRFLQVLFHKLIHAQKDNDKYTTLKNYLEIQYLQKHILNKVDHSRLYCIVKLFLSVCAVAKVTLISDYYQSHV